MFAKWTNNEGEKKEYGCSHFESMKKNSRNAYSRQKAGGVKKKCNRKVECSFSIIEQISHLAEHAEGGLGFLNPSSMLFSYCLYHLCHIIFVCVLQPFGDYNINSLFAGFHNSPFPSSTYHEAHTIIAFYIPKNLNYILLCKLHDTPLR